MYDKASAAGHRAWTARACIGAAALVTATWLAMPAGAVASRSVTARAAAVRTAPAAGGASHATTLPSAAPVAASRRLAADVLPGLRHAMAAGPASPGRVLTVGVGLALPHPAAAQAYYAAEYDPGSPDYHHFLSPAAFAQRFGVAPATYARVLAWLRSGGLDITQTTPAGDWVSASGTVAQLERLFRTPIGAYTVGGIRFLANTRAPVVPAGDSIITVVGLNTLQRFYTPHAPANARTAATPGMPGCLPSCTYGPQDMWSLYDMPSSDLGQGQSMAIFGEGRTDDVIANLRLFERHFGLRQVPVTVTHVGKGSFTDDSGQGEWDLDSQSSTGMSPDAYGLNLFFAPSLYDADVESLFTAWVKNPNAPKQANASFGECETNPTNPVTGPLAQLPYGIALGDQLEPVAEQTLLQATMEGRTLFSSAGDTGSSCPAVVLPVVSAGNGVANQGVPFQNYPCASDYAVCVGGTVLWSTGTTPARRAVERAWEYTGGGAALFQKEPAFQKKDGAVNVPCAMDQNASPFPAGTICRGAPDVAAMSGDLSDNGYNIYESGSYTPGGGAGTSLSSPLWMGMWTRVQSAAPARGLGFADWTIYRVGESAAYSRDFYDVTVGDNGLYRAAPGWDYTTGWGVPDIRQLMRTVDGRLTPTHDILPPASGGTSGGIPRNSACTALWTNPAHTASDALGNSDPQLTLLEGNMATSADHKTLVVRMTVANLSPSVPAGTTGEDWYMTWTYRGTTYFANAQLSALPTSAPAFSDGTVTKTGKTNSYSRAHTDHGRLRYGKDGLVEIDVPLANVGHPPLGTVLGAPTGLTYSEAGVPDNPTGVYGGSLQTVDTGGPNRSYVLGTTTGLTGCRLPE